MHGRIKVKTTAEQQEAKRKEREKKMKMYTAATQKAFQKRKDKEYDSEALAVTGEILAVNSDFYTLWNFRKEVFLHMKENKSEEELQPIFTDELHFLEACLQRNPKSYGVWHHRSFVMDTMPQPDWKRELQLCNTFLEYDERNFHCWDYRRFVVRRSSVPPEEELAFTSSKICNNFSNFSSWHYRSKLLPVVSPDEFSPLGVQEDVLIKEYETVQNAFFTDPDDQSAWFYHRWLLGRGKKKTGVCCMYASRTPQMLMITTTQPIKICPSECEIEVTVNGNRSNGVWTNHSNRNNNFSNVWLYHQKEGILFLPRTLLEITVAADAEDWGSSETIYLKPDQSEAWTVTQEESGARFRHEMSAVTSDTLQRELESVQELFEIEPENKWVVLTIVSLMKAVDPRRYADEVEGLIQKLQELDPCRLHYYRDLGTRFVIENYLEGVDFNERVMSLASRNLTTLYHPELLSLVVKLDLSDNSLEHLKNFSCLRCVRELNLDKNKIKEVEELSFLINLQQLSIRDNLLPTQEALQPLSKCTSLASLNIAGNPAADELKIDSVQTLLPSLTSIDDTELGAP